MLTFDKGMNDLIFSLDIGTRTVIGIVGKITENGKFTILANSIMEHNRRNMYDGQIHDIEGVTKIVTEIKKDLESKLGIQLKKASIAAAGRSLISQKVRLDKDIDATMEIDKNMVGALELESIQRAQEYIDKEKSREKLKYYCVGYSVMSYYLDGVYMEKLEGHKGSTMGAEILATFLPQIVVDSLYSVVIKAGLEVENITLEPIAAINVAIAESLRLLNLALVDIGAGTSDIAITRDGKIIAYAMIPIAGDEITEGLCKTYLLDFNSGEKLKIELNKKDKHEFSDVVGVTHKISTEEIIGSISDTINYLAKEISEKILEYNGKAPSAVFLIGGSSQLPNLKESISGYLNIPKERVVVKNADSIDNVEGLTGRLKGPDIITPIGIAMEGINNTNQNFLKVYLNREEIRIFNTENIKVSDVLILVNFDPRDLIPYMGEETSFYVNGNKKVIKGEAGVPSIIYVNDKIANLNTVLRNNDEINITKSMKGKKKEVYLFDCIPMGRMVTLNKREISLISDVKVNDIPIKENIKIKDEDKIEYKEIGYLRDLIQYMNLTDSNLELYVNGEKADENYLLKDNDVILTKDFNLDDKDKNSSHKKIYLNINGKKEEFEYNKSEFVFVDIFDYIDFDLKNPQGRLILKLNNKTPEYMERLKDGDHIELYWEK
ncbi:cell division protein FtsA [Sporanaerobacter sp. PP17-6a]|jgi:cell division protein FtsA|uniref:Chaperone protein DnaK n=2 Tax=Acidilutibacter cellobiosedens TaxID=2507161 RepID=A0A410QF38_9FIRM|nr:cell division FtsA domain-containing protein [Sporanaerobacter sp. PP17-6a]MBE6081634.1 cell division protein FtsA [Tissierellaceae bacterium]QAT62438.1 cell division protein FtsA [Acidilutibacter cellobiosedens]SCL89073.1 Cell division protein FtsA [Sporanaerobacter sp. PP17-6a]